MHEEIKNQTLGSLLFEVILVLLLVSFFALANQEALRASLIIKKRTAQTIVATKELRESNINFQLGNYQ